MKRFTELYLQLGETTRTSEKLSLLRSYFQTAPPLDAAWVVYLMQGRKLGKTVSTTLLRKWAGEDAGLSPWLVDECYRAVGDLSEAISLLVPQRVSEPSTLPLHEIIEQRICPLSHLSIEQQRKSIEQTWSLLTSDQRLAFHKLLSGNFRVGVSATLMMRALAEAIGIEPAVVAHRLAGQWKPNADTLLRLKEPQIADAALPYPFMLSHALQQPPEELGEPCDWLMEWKWDGIRAQLVRRQSATALWSRGDEMIADAFPELIHAAASVPMGTVLDGEIVAWDSANDRPLPFTHLQRRLNRKTVHATFWPEVPVRFIVFDLLECDGVDWRDRPLSERRAKLTELCKSICHEPLVGISAEVPCDDWAQAVRRVAEARQRFVEGLMLKRRSSVYSAGRPTGAWWKLKIEPHTIDAVLIAAEPGRGRRAGLLTDYTFGVWNDDVLVPVAKAYSGLTDQEIAEVDRFARRHTIERHGPVHSIEPLMVFELEFEAIQRSTRHKAGLALRFPRMLRMRKDKTAKEADRLTTLHELLRSREGSS
ncbi:MAG: ATP-dependent DNA ligase [Phycisphaerae bacterium]|nr:ATP-dependent DNA ligase [Phycisphaerae bacterium]